MIISEARIHISEKAMSEKAEIVKVVFRRKPKAKALVEFNPSAIHNQSDGADDSDRNKSVPDALTEFKM